MVFVLLNGCSQRAMTNPKTTGNILASLCHMQELTVLSSTQETHLPWRQSMFTVLQSAGEALRPLKLWFGPGSIGHLAKILFGLRNYRGLPTN